MNRIQKLANFKWPTFYSELPRSYKLYNQKRQQDLNHFQLVGQINKHTLNISAEAGPGKTPTFAHLELRMVQSKKLIEEPEMCIRGEVIGEIL